MNNSELLTAIASGSCDARLERLYGAAEVPGARARLTAAAGEFGKRFGQREGLMIVSAPGRTEVGGNHTDHNGGRVLAAAVGLDIVAVAAPSGDGVARLVSEGFDGYEVDLSDLAPRPAEENTSEALIRGIAAAMAGRGLTVGGFAAYAVSRVPKGSGLSSSAAFEVLVCNILSHLYHGGRLGAEEAAAISRWAENNYFGKPCGLMDQMASSVGGFVAIDFGNRERPVVERIPFDVEKEGHALCIVDTKGSHDDLTPDYAAIPAEMKAVAAALGTDVLAHADAKALWERAPALRRLCGDRAFLRAVHFFDDDRRVGEQTAALRAGDFAAFLELARRSGRSSWTLLQNVQVPSAPREQGLAVALCFTERFLDGGGACRVHGGGFAGTIQAYVPLERLTDYRAAIEGLFGSGSCHVVRVRPEGGARIV